MKYGTAVTVFIVCAVLFLGGLFARGADVYNINIKTWFDTPATLKGGTASLKYGSSDYSVVQAGQFDAEITGTKPFGHPSGWVTYCTDFKNFLEAGSFTVRSLTIADNHPEWQNPDWVDGGIQRAMALYITYGASVDTAAEAVAMQVSIWESLYDSTPSLTDGAFRMRADGSTAGAFGIAQGWLSSKAASPLSGYEVWWEPTTANGSYRSAQGLLGQGQVVPEGSTYLAGLAVGAAIGWRYRKVIRGRLT